MTSSTTLGTTGPVSGDVVIARDRADQKESPLSILPGPPQVRCSTFEDARLTANSWASRRRVAIWFTEDEQIFTPVSVAGERATAHGVDKPQETS